MPNPNNTPQTPDKQDSKQELRPKRDKSAKAFRYATWALLWALIAWLAYTLEHLEVELSDAQLMAGAAFVGALKLFLDKVKDPWLGK